MEPGPSKAICVYCNSDIHGGLPCPYVTPEKLVPEPAPPAAPRKPRNFKCETCEKAFPTKGKLALHMTVHTGERRYTCEHCSKGFNSKFKLVRHMVVHSRLREWECVACGTSFRRKDHLEAHVKHHCGDRTTYPCQHCSKTYTCKGSLRKHAALHSAQAGNLNCQLCAFVAPDQEAIVAHVRSHSGSRLSKSAADKKYRCADCGRSFFTRKDAVRHSVVHTRRRDFLCEFCPRTFGRNDHLTRHIEKAHAQPLEPSRPSTSGLSSAATTLEYTPEEAPRSANVLPGFSQAFRDV